MTTARPAVNFTIARIAASIHEPIARTKKIFYILSDFDPQRVFTREMNDAIELLKRYGRDRDEQAFREVVARFFGLVHGVALRRLNGNEAAAMDITQMVFADLARKAAGFSKETLLGGWLHAHTCFVASKLIRTEMRRTAREQEAAFMNSEDSGDVWRSMSPSLDEALQELSEPDRSAILLRFFEGHDLRGVGAALRVSEDAAQKRVTRALDRLKALLEARGVTISVTVLAAALTANASAAPAAGTIQSVSNRAISSHPSDPVPEAFLQSASAKFAIAIACLLLLMLGGVWVWSHKGSSDGRDVTSVENTPTAQQATVAQNRAADTAVNPTSAAAATAGNVQSAHAQETAGDPNELVVHVLNRLDQKPIAGATVRVSTATSPRPTGVINEGDLALITDADGVARIPVTESPPDRLLVEAWAKGFTGWLSIWEPRKGETIPREHTMLLDPGVLIGGRVIDDRGKPIESAAVQLTRIYRGDEPIDRGNSRQMINTTTNITDARGVWTDNHIPESLLENIHIRIARDGYAATNTEIDPPKMAELRAGAWTVALTEGARIAGRVTDTNSAPIARAEVAFASRFSRNRQKTLTDADGRYELRDVTFETLTTANVVVASASGYAAVIQNLTNTSPNIELNFQLNHGAPIRGRVVSSTGEPIQGALVGHDSNEIGTDAVDWSARTDAEGRFAWDSPPPKPQSFFVGAQGYVQIRGRMLAPQPDEEVITLTKRATLRGVVNNAATGAPVAEFFVLPAQGDVQELSSWTEANEKKFKNGIFDIDLNETTHNVVQIRATGFFTRIFEIPKGKELVAQLEPSRTLEGVVLDASGQPVRGAQLAALTSSFSSYVSLNFGRFTPGQINADHCTTDDQGHFTLPLGARATSLVAVHPNAGYADTPVPDADQTIELRLRPWGRIEGTIVADRMPLAGAEVSLNNDETLRVLLNNFHTTTDVAGRFTFEQVPPRELTVSRIVPITATARRTAEHTNLVVVPGAVTYLELAVDKNPKLDTDARR